MGKTFSCCPLNMMLAVGFSYMAFIMLRHDPSIPTLLSVFIINGCWILSNAFQHLLIWSCDFCLSFCVCDILHLLICEYCTVLASLEWISLDHGVWSFWCIVGSDWQYFVGDFSMYVHQRYCLVVFFLCCVFVCF